MVLGGTFLFLQTLLNNLQANSEDPDQNPPDAALALLEPVHNKDARLIWVKVPCNNFSVRSGLFVSVQENTPFLSCSLYICTIHTIRFLMHKHALHCEVWYLMSDI